MAARLRSAAGFYNGGGVNPQPTPVPTTDLATYREIEWNGSTVKALCDVYGRLFTRYDSSNNEYNGVAWADESLDKTFDSIGEHEQAFMALINTYGHNDAVTHEGVENVEINIDGTLTEFVFENGECVPVPSLWQQGSVNTLFYRTLNNGTADITVICDSDGKLVVSSGDSYFEYLVAADQIREADANLNALIAAAGGSVVADVFSDNDGNYLLISLDGYTVVADLDGILALGNITEYKVLVFTVWGNQACTEKPSGEIEEAYLKVENNVTLPYGQVGDQLFTTEEDNNIRIAWYYDFFAEVQTIQVGDIIKMQAPSPGIEVDGAETEFYA